MLRSGGRGPLMAKGTPPKRTPIDRTWGTRGECGRWANGGRTTVRGQTFLMSQLPMLISARVEKFSARKYDENGEKQRKGMISVLEMLREKYLPQHI